MYAINNIHVLLVLHFALKGTKRRAKNQKNFEFFFQIDKWTNGQMDVDVLVVSDGARTRRRKIIIIINIIYNIYIIYNIT